MYFEIMLLEVSPWYLSRSSGLVPYSIKPVIKNKKHRERIEIRNLK